MAARPVSRRILDRWISDSITYEDRHITSRLSDGLLESRRQGRFTDMNVVVEDKAFPCHKFVLEANCPYFKAYFSFSGETEDVRTVQVDGIAVSAFELMLDFLYTSKLTVNLGNAQELMQCADFLQCSDIVAVCGSFLTQHLSADNCLDLYQCAEAFSEHSLKEAAFKFAVCHFREIVKTPAFMSLSVDILQKIISENTLAVPTESNVLAALLQWLTHDSLRMATVTPALAAIRWKFVESCFVDGLSTAVTDDVRKLVLDAKSRHMSEESKRLIPVVGVVDIELSAGLSFYSKPGGEFFEEAMFPFTSRTRFHCAQLGNTLYITGGRIRHEDKVTAEVNKFDIATFKWEQKAPMKTARFDHSSSAVNGRLYVLGGKENESQTVSLEGEVYNPDTNQWSAIKPLPSSVNLTGCPTRTVSVQSKLFVLAARFSGHVWALEYDPLLDSWARVPELENTPIDVKSCCSASGLLFFFEPEYEVEPRRRHQRGRLTRDPDQYDYSEDSDDDEDSKVAKISRLCIFDPLDRSLPLQGGSTGFELLRAERKIDGGVVQHGDNLLVFRYTKDPDDAMFMYEAEVLTLNLLGPTPRFRFFADYNALPFDGSELVAFSGFTSPDLL